MCSNMTCHGIPTLVGWDKRSRQVSLTLSTPLRSALAGQRQDRGRARTSYIPELYTLHAPVLRSPRVAALAQFMPVRLTLHTLGVVSNSKAYSLHLHILTMLTTSPWGRR